jgi:hypothetical protein
MAFLVAEYPVVGRGETVAPPAECSFHVWSSLKEIGLRRIKQSGHSGNTIGAVVRPWVGFQVGSGRGCLRMGPH